MGIPVGFSVVVLVVLVTRVLNPGRDCLYSPVSRLPIGLKLCTVSERFFCQLCSRQRHCASHCISSINTSCIERHLVCCACKSGMILTGQSMCCNCVAVVSMQAPLVLSPIHLIRWLF